MAFREFELERWQSRWEHRVTHNLSESGVDPLSIRELIAMTDLSEDDVLDSSLEYSQGNGSDALRDAVAQTYRGLSRENVLITTGSSEANFLTCWSLLEPGDRVGVVTPTYAQTLGLAENFGAEVDHIPLLEASGWEPDLDRANEAIGPETKLVVVTNPNNPTGHIISREAVESIVAMARAHGSWVLVDEVYRGAELNRTTTESMVGTYDRCLVSCGLSKAYGLPGLRIGWIAGSDTYVEEAWARHDYTVICPTPVSDLLATAALGARDEILNRTRNILTANLPIVTEWARDLPLHLELQEPEAGAICWFKAPGFTNGRRLAEFLRTEYDTLIVPGEHFGVPGYIRLGYGNESGKLREDLSVLGDGLTAAMSQQPTLGGV